MSSTALKILWFAAFALIFFTFIAYSALLPLFGERTEQAWQWLLPNLLPPFGIVFGLQIVAKASAKAAVEVEVKPTGAASASWALAMSLVYLAALLFSVFGVLFAADPIAFLNTSNYWLAPLLAVTTAVLGVRLAGSA